MALLPKVIAESGATIGNRHIITYNNVSYYMPMGATFSYTLCV